MKARRAAEPTVAILGAYRVEPSAPLISKALRQKYGNSTMSPADKRKAERHVTDEVGSAVLFELLISNRDERFRVDDFGQVGSDQAAYDEKYLSLDGKRVIAEGFEIPDRVSLRICFYLHFVDVSRPLRTSYGLCPIPPVKAIPRRLEKLAPYEPVD